MVEAGGSEFLATHLIRLAAEAGPTRTTNLLAAGDLVGATPLLSAAFHDEPSIEAMNLLGLAVSSVGNHEFDHGSDELLRLQYGGCHPDDGCQDGTGFDGAAFPLLGANVIDEATGERLLAPCTIRRYGGVRIGFIGLTLEGTPLVTTAAGVAGLRFLDEAETINALVRAAEPRRPRHRRADSRGQLADRPVLGVHRRIGRSAADPRRARCGGVGGGLGPHPQGLRLRDHGRLVTSAAHAGRIITDIDLTHDERTGRITSQDARNVIVTRDVARDAAQTALIALIAHYETGAQRDSMLEQQWQLANGVEKANLLSVSFGFSYDWSASAPLGTRIDPASIRLDGAVIDPAASYRITVDSLLAAGGADDQPGDPAALTAQVSAG